MNSAPACASSSPAACLRLDVEQSATAEKIASLATQIDAQAATVETMDTEHTEGIRARLRPWTSRSAKHNAQANQSAVELERITARTARQRRPYRRTDQPPRHRHRRSRAGAASSWHGLAGELEQHRSFLENATAEAAALARQAQAHQAAGPGGRPTGRRSRAAGSKQNRRASMQFIQRHRSDPQRRGPGRSSSRRP